MDELERLIREQREDDTDLQSPERFGAQGRVGTVPHVEQMQESVETPKIGGTYRTQPTSSLPPRRTRTQSERDLLFRVTENLMQDVPRDAEQAIRLVVYAQASFRQAAEIMRLPLAAVQRRIGQAFREMKKVLQVRSGSDELSFPQRPSRDKTDHYQRRYGVAKKPAVCAAPDCITGLSRYNLSNVCRVHRGGAITESEFNLAYILGVVKRGGQDVRSATTPQSSAVHEHDVWAGPWAVPDTTVEEPEYLDEPYVPVPRGPVDHLVFRGAPSAATLIKRWD